MFKELGYICSAPDHCLTEKEVMHWFVGKQYYGFDKNATFVITYSPTFGVFIVSVANSIV